MSPVISPIEDLTFKSRSSIHTGVLWKLTNSTRLPFQHAFAWIVPTVVSRETDIKSGLSLYLSSGSFFSWISIVIIAIIPCPHWSVYPLGFMNSAAASPPVIASRIIPPNMSYKTVQLLLDQTDKTNKDKIIENISNEVGSLIVTNGKSGGKYIGAATGLNFARLFLKQIDLQNKLKDAETSELQRFDSDVLESCAALPSKKIATFLLSKYIDSVQIYFPLYSIPYLHTLLANVYAHPNKLSHNDKYTLFMILAIASSKLTNRASIHNPFISGEYFNTASRYLENILSNRSEKSLQALLLLIIWKMESNALEDDNGDLWHLSRFCMSLAMELGVHRFLPVWNFGEARSELRNRLFWCTYIVDRTVAMKFGRGLSLRKQAIDTPLPKLSVDDSTPEVSSYRQIQFLPCIMLIRICEICGDMLESVYISRAIGETPLLKDDKVQKTREDLQKKLDSWMGQVENEIPHHLTCYLELKARYSVVSVVLNRPSPSFLVPDASTIALCKSHCISCISAYKDLINRDWKVTPTCLHDTLATGLTMVYCCWRLDENSEEIQAFSADIKTVMLEACKYYEKYMRFKNLYEAVSTGIIEFLDSEPVTKQRRIMDTPQSNHHEQFEWNEWFSQEVFQNGFRQFYDLESDKLFESLSEFFPDGSRKDRIVI
ncbi:hypothetical protein OGAPHI_005412 [Ogataea philodendri]|uniref:Xylanolytic transcriptional activator regulatory domain-containing protein n=1 Tax=Ogataea philodendri TaxID=1378263 RepID=A0A9P8T1H7_9ASCO|nr:uncharacterized protein OGAPHI_005412 [Ogataea philodendri]KAH3662164.1 hypothetical protein OGAPHI_005412 [Ogataea philodendri]